jgi:hypothetical protein
MTVSRQAGTSMKNGSDRSPAKIRRPSAQLP